MICSRNAFVSERGKVFEQGSVPMTSSQAERKPGSGPLLALWSLAEVRSSTKEESSGP